MTEGAKFPLDRNFHIAFPGSGKNSSAAVSAAVVGASRPHVPGQAAFATAGKGAGATQLLNCQIKSFFIISASTPLE
jgi:hypothetical protein